MASKLLLNALKAKIVSNPFAAAPPGGQQQDDPAAEGQVVGDFHLTPAAGPTGAQPVGSGVSGGQGQAAAPAPVADGVSPSLLTPPAELNLKALVPAGVAAPPSDPPALQVAEAVKVTVPLLPAEPALAPVATSDAVVFPQLTLETDHEAEELAAKVKALEGQKRKLVFKRAMPRVAGFAVLAMASLSIFAFSGLPPVPGGAIQADVVDTTGTDERITPLRFLIEVTKTCSVDPTSRTKLQEQLRDEGDDLTVNESIAYWVFACNHPLEAYVDRGFGPWAVEHGIVSQEDGVAKPLTRSVMQKIFTASIP